MEDWIKDCDFLAPYLKEKLAQDKEHTWRDAPYIHEDVKKALEEIQAKSARQNIDLSYLCSASYMDPRQSNYSIVNELQARQADLEAQRLYCTQQNQNAFWLANLQNSCISTRFMK